MPTERLKQALRSANIANVEKDMPEAIAKLFDVPPALVQRILFAARLIAPGFLPAKSELPPELEEAITKAMKAAQARVRMRHYISTNNSEGRVFWRKILADGPPVRICDGCPFSLDCVADSLSTPEHCMTGEGPIRQSAIVRPTRIHNNQVTVECEHPKGTFMLDAQDIG